MLREKISLFINYLDFFHRLNIKYLSRYYHKLEMMVNQINSDIRFEEKNDENASYEIIDVREMKENQVIQNPNATTHLEKFFETPHDNNIPSDLISELSVETIVTETPSKSNSNNLKKKKYRARKKNKQQMTNTANSSDYNSEFVVSGDDKNIQLVIEETPVAIVEEAPVVVVEESPVVVLEEAPVVVVEESPVAVPEEAPVVVPEEAPVAVPEEPPVVVVEEAPVILEENTNNV
jgi:hypothetical protein